jgi:predicted dehydrogenase
MLKGALIGFGQVAENAHAPAWKKDTAAIITAAVEANAERRAAAEKLFPGIKTYASLSALLKSKIDIDFVDIATPPHMHAAQCLEALQAKKHVLCEKPLVLKKKDFTELKKAAQKNDRALFTTHNWKHAPIFQKLRTLLDENSIGPISHIEWHTLRKQPAAVAVGKGNWRTDKKFSGGGILIDHGWHAMYLMCWLAGKKPLGASGVLKFPKANGSKASDTEREATCLIDFGDLSALVHLTWNASSRGHWGVLHGRDGSITLSDDRLDLSRGGKPPTSYAFAEALSKGSAHPDWFSAMLKDFHIAMEKPAKRKENLDEANHCIELIEELYKSNAR